MFRLSAEVYKLTLYNLFFNNHFAGLFFFFEVSLYSGVGQTSGIY